PSRGGRPARRDRLPRHPAGRHAHGAGASGPDPGFAVERHGPRHAAGRPRAAAVGPMADDTQLLYLEPDDEVTSVVRRLREADASRVVLVASGRTKATTSAVALRLRAQVAAEEGHELILVADPGARALAAEAGIAAFASVADANVEGAVPA